MKSPIRNASLAAAAFCLSAALPAEAGADMLGSTFFDWDKLPAKTTPVGTSRAVVDAPTPTMERFECHVTTLHPGYQSHPPHHHPQEELILLKEGTLESSINGNKERIGAGSLLFFASHDVHNVTNVGDKPATYYVINFYTAATATVRNQPAAEWAPPDRLRSSVIDWDKRVAKPSATDTRYYLVDSPTLTFARLAVHATTMNPGAPPSKAHRHPWLELIVMKEGTMEMTVDGVSHAVGPGSIAYLASNSLQSMRNPGAVPATYFVFSVVSAATPKAAD
jgi:quercetin dioxygenase-like cupin family protein